MTKMKSEEQVVLVDEHDQPVGQMDKLQAHIDGVLHRAFSVFVVNSDGEFLLQQRALHKYHSAGLWSNTCCSHPRPDETVLVAANRRLDEEMGLACDLQSVFSFVYRAKLEKDLIEYEYDHVLIGRSDAQPILNEEEVADYRYASADEIRTELERHDGSYSEWFRISFERVVEVLNGK